MTVKTPDPAVKQIIAHCGRMDQGGCRLLVTVEGDRIVKVAGDPAGPLNRGYTCVKGRACHTRLTQPGRLTKPLKRRGKAGSFQEITWDDALAEIAAKLNAVKAEHGPGAVAFCQGMPKGLEHFALIRLANTFGSPNVVGPQNLCHMPREISGLHTCGFYPVVDHDKPWGCVMLFGSNPTSTNEEGQIHVQLLDQLKAGSDLVVVDPQRTDLAQRAMSMGERGAWLQVRPGGESVLALNLLSVVIEEDLIDRPFVDQYCHGFDKLTDLVASFRPEETTGKTGLEAGEVRRAVRLYAQADPAALQWGNGVEQSPANFDVCRALISLMALCGNLDKPGGNIDAGQGPGAGLGPFVRADLMPKKYKDMVSAAHGVVPRFMVVPPPYFRQAVLKGEPYPIKAAYVQTCNPLLAYSNSPETEAALKALDLLVVTDITMTPSAALADYVLPAATHFEFSDVGHYGLGHGFILARPKVINPPPDCRPDIEIINQLAKALGLGEYWFDDYRKLIDDLLAPTGLSYAEFTEKSMLARPKKYFKYREKGFRTPSGRVELSLSKAESGQLDFPALPKTWGPEEDPDYPLLLTTAKPADFMCSSDRALPALRDKRSGPLVKIHPDTAAAAGLQNGQEVVIETKAGAIVQTACVWDGVRPEVIVAEPGWWFPENRSPDMPAGDWRRANVNMLTGGELSRAFGTPNMRSLPCRVRPA